MNDLNTTSTQEELTAETYVCTAMPFELGQLVMTQSISSLLSDNLAVSLQVLIMRHKSGDWGNISVEDKVMNDEATRTGERVLSEYSLCGERIWIITERDRSVTTVLLPIEY
ncbi:type I restriction endonuclease subunit M [Vibrio neptunius]|uniref:type I restriction endonuclease subunit M n=1 Tax=Vibrio neptunius TaxID=170651 RepID=UPI003CE45354